MIGEQLAVICDRLRITLRRFTPCSSGHITADKRQIDDFSKLPLATAFIRETL